MKVLFSESWAELKEPVRDIESARDYQQQGPITTHISPVGEALFSDQMRTQSHDRDRAAEPKPEATGKKNTLNSFSSSLFTSCCDSSGQNLPEPEDSAVFED